MPSDILSIISTKRLQQEARDWRRKECLEILKSSLSSLSPPSSSSSSSSSSTTTTTTTAIVEGVIATAHHADDQIETFMMKFLRGVHISNLYPMLPRSDCDHFIKPFLNVNKSIIIKYMKANSYQWYEDQSNESKKYKRNEIRLDLIPLLSRYFYY
jgi:tRNA(Ile)-lysidine synthetase-like protein